MIWLVAILIFIMLASAMAVLMFDDAVSAVAATSAVSLALSILFVILRAPDVAMTEAVVGTGLSTVIMALALRRLGINKFNREDRDA